MTPDVIFRGKLHNGIWVEFSYGTGIFTSYIIGLTLLGNSFSQESLDKIQGAFRTIEDLETAFLKVLDFKGVNND
jgi:hypothetical protein